MKDYRILILGHLENDIPELKDKIQAEAVDEGTKAPFAVFMTPEEVPIRTKDGIAGYNILFEISVYDRSVSGATSLQQSVINSLEGVQLDKKTCRYKSSTKDYYPEYDLHSVTLTFRII